MTKVGEPYSLAERKLPKTTLLMRDYSCLMNLNLFIFNFIIIMRRKFTILMFGLLLAVGWTNSAQAQRLPAEAPVKQLMKAAVKPQPIVAESMGVSVAHTQGLDALNLASPARANVPMRAGVDLNRK